MTEHIQNKTTLLNSFLILIIPHPSPLQSLQSVVFLCVCVLRLTDIVTNVTSQSLYSRSPICYTLRDLCMHTHSHTYTHTSSLAAWCLCRSCHHPSGEQPRRVSRLFPLFFWLSVSCDISLVFIEGLAASSSFFLSTTLLWLERLCTRVSHILAHVNPVGISAVTQRYGLYSEVVLICRHAARWKCTCTCAELCAQPLMMSFTSLTHYSFKQTPAFITCLKTKAFKPAFRLLASRGRLLWLCI